MKKVNDLIIEENQKLDKYIGALIGAAAGDALGWPNEQNSKNTSKEALKDKELFQKWTRRDGTRFWLHNEDIFPGEYSDDTQLIIATARSLRFGNSWSKHFTRIELPVWLSYERGGGGATKRAAEVWRRGSNPWNPETEKKADIDRYFNAGGNGVAMRILPHLFGNENNWDEISRQVFLNGISTHGHPRALIGALIYADALQYLLNNEKTLGYGELVEFLLTRKEKWGVYSTDKIESWKYASELAHKGDYNKTWSDVISEVIKLLQIVKDGLNQGTLDMGNEVLEKLGCFDKNVNGSGTVTAVAAIYLASKYASSPRLALTEAAYLKNGDTDTLASMVGGLLGMLYGSEFLSLAWLDVQDYKFIKELIHYKPKVGEQIKAPIFDYYKDEIRSKIKKMKIGDSLTFIPFGELKLRDKKLNKPNTEGILVHTLKLVSEEGQTIFVKTYEKSKVEAADKSIEISQTLTNQNFYQDQLSIEEFDKKIINKPALDSTKVRGLVNILPSNMNSDLLFLFIADVMDEVERSGNKANSMESINFLLNRWEKHSIDAKDINKAIQVIMKY
jgi:ADP-ribosylglycohydrolase